MKHTTNQYSKTIDFRITNPPSVRSNVCSIIDSVLDDWRHRCDVRFTVGLTGGSRREADETMVKLESRTIAHLHEFSHHLHTSVNRVPLVHVQVE